MDKFYSELITDKFLNKIHEIKEKAGFVKDTSKRKILEYTFIFVDPKKCKSITVEESNLEKRVIDDNINIKNIIVLLNTESLYCEYWNLDYFLIGIFNMQYQKSYIEFESIGIKSFTLSHMIHLGHYNTDLITSCNLIMLNNPFIKYIRDVMRPIRRSIDSTLTTSFFKCDDFEIQEEQIPFSVSPNGMTLPYCITSDLDQLLQIIKEMDEKFTDSLFNSYGSSRFKPEDYITNH